MPTLARELKDMTIVVVDDEMDNLSIITKAIECLGGRAYCATNGEAAISILEVVRPTLILLDLSMPAMNGWETQKAIRARPEFNLVPVIALTAHAMQEDKERVLAAGFDGYISKPFRPSKLIEEIRRALLPSG